MKHVVVRHKAFGEKAKEWTLFYYDKHDQLTDVRAWQTSAKARADLNREGYWQRVEWTRIHNEMSHTLYWCEKPDFKL